MLQLPLKSSSTRGYTQYNSDSNPTKVEVMTIRDGMRALLIFYGPSGETLNSIEWLGGLDIGVIGSSQTLSPENAIVAANAL